MADWQDIMKMGPVSSFGDDSWERIPDYYFDNPFKMTEEEDRAWHKQVNKEKAERKKEVDEFKEKAVNVGSFGGKALGIAAGIALSQVSKQTQIGNFNANILQYGYGKPYVTITRKKQYNPSEIGDMYGRPSNEYVKLSELRGKGYTRVKDIHIEISCTEKERDQIESALKGGVIL